MGRRKMSSVESKADKRGSHEAERPKDEPLHARMDGIPIESLLTTVRGPVHIELDDPGKAQGAQFRVDEEEWHSLNRRGGVWRGDLNTESLGDGAHHLEIKATKSGGVEESVKARFRVRNRNL